MNKLIHEISRRLLFIMGAMKWQRPTNLCVLYWRFILAAVFFVWYVATLFFVPEFVHYIIHSFYIGTPIDDIPSLYTSEQEVSIPSFFIPSVIMSVAVAAIIVLFIPFFSVVLIVIGILVLIINLISSKLKKKESKVTKPLVCGIKSAFNKVKCDLPVDYGDEK